eukprot:768038-Hanusia_phi.AAC.3
MHVVPAFQEGEMNQVYDIMRRVRREKVGTEYRKRYIKGETKANLVEAKLEDLTSGRAEDGLRGSGRDDGEEGRREERRRGGERRGRGEEGKRGEGKRGGGGGEEGRRGGGRTRNEEREVVHRRFLSCCTPSPTLPGAKGPWHPPLPTVVDDPKLGLPSYPLSTPPYPS